MEAQCFGDKGAMAVEQFRVQLADNGKLELMLPEFVARHLEINVMPPSAVSKKFLSLELTGKDYLFDSPVQNLLTTASKEACNAL